MSRFGITVREILKRTVIVEAEDLTEAMEKVQAAVQVDKILLDMDDYDDREIVPSEYWPGGEVPAGEDVSYYYHLEEDEDTRIVDAIFVSVWDDGHKIESNCKVNLDSQEIFDIEPVNVDDLDLQVLRCEQVVINGIIYPAARDSIKNTGYWYS